MRRTVLIPIPLLIGVIWLVMASVSAFAAAIDPPWCEPPSGGVNFTVPGVNNVPDLHGDMANPDLVVFFEGNQFMVLPELMDAFRSAHPQVKNIYYQTLPSGILEKQVREGSLVVGNLKVSLKPDIFTAGEPKIKELNEKEGWFDETVAYAKNRLAIMVHKGNPKALKSLEDLGREDTRVSMPNPEIEEIAKLIKEAYRKAGGERLESRIMTEKKREGTTFLTQIHHRQTPMRIMRKESDAGPVWYTEVKFQQSIGNPIELVEIPPEQSATSVYAAARMKDAPHLKAASDFLQFLKSERAQSIYGKYGFLPVSQ